MLLVSQKGPTSEVLRKMEDVVLFIYTVTLVLFCFDHSVTACNVFKRMLLEIFFFIKDYFPSPYNLC